RGGVQVEMYFAVEPLLDDFEMQEAEEAAAEAEAERGGGLHLVSEARVIEAKLAHGRAQRLEIGSIDRKQAAEHHRDRGAEARQRRRDRLAVVGDGVADAGVGDFLDRGGLKNTLPRAALGRRH